MERINTNYVLVGVLSHIPRENQKFKYIYSKFHKFFFKHKSNYGVLKDLMFDINGNFPICNELDHAYSNLTLSGSIESCGFNSNLYEISEACKLTFEDIREKFSNHQNKELSQISGLFKEEFCLEEVLTKK